MTSSTNEGMRLPKVLETQLYFFLGGGRHWFYRMYRSWRQDWNERLMTRQLPPEFFKALLREALKIADGPLFDSPRQRLQRLHGQMIHILCKKKPATDRERVMIAIEELIKSGVWYPGPKGRLLPTETGWSLLWPLAGRDLEGRCELGENELARALTEREVLIGDWRREDGRLMKALTPAAEIQALMSRVV